MPGSRDHNWRATPAPYPAFVPAILQRHPNAPVIGQGLTANEIRPGGRPHSSAADPRRIAPSLRPELIFDRHSQLQVGSCHCEAPDATLVVQIEAPSLAPPFSRAPIAEAEILLDRRHFSPRNLGPISKVQLCFCWSRLLDRKLGTHAATPGRAKVCTKCDHILRPDQKLFAHALEVVRHESTDLANNANRPCCC
jgi:hypothetical protein